jgi:site-specific DNA-cytosine methylase
MMGVQAIPSLIYTLFIFTIPKSPRWLLSKSRNEEAKKVLDSMGQLADFEVIKREPTFDLMIAHPPCTFLAVSGARHLYNKDGSPNLERYKNQKEGLDFVQKLMDVNIKHIVIENPVSVISSQIRKPDQIIQPWQFGDAERKSTCLWLKNLPALQATSIVAERESSKVPGNWFNKGGKNRQHERARTFEGIAQAMAEQWGAVL